MHHVSHRKKVSLRSLGQAHHNVGVASGSLLAAKSSLHRSHHQQNGLGGIQSQCIQTSRGDRLLILRFILLGVIFFFFLWKMAVDQQEQSQLRIWNLHLEQGKRTSEEGTSLLYHDQDLAIISPVHHPYDQLLPVQEQAHEFLLNHPDSTGANFIRLLQANLYNSHDNHEELQRLKACQALSHHNDMTQQLSNSPLCFAASVNYKKSLSSVQQLGDELNMKPVAILSNTTLLEQHTPIRIHIPQQAPDFGDHEKNGKAQPITASTVYQIRRYGPENNPKAGSVMDPHHNSNAIQDKLIPNLGTPVACLPLLLAGTAVALASSETTTSPLVVELGPYFGLSSKCLATGMQLLSNNNPQTKQSPNDGNTNNPNPMHYFAFDTFAGHYNLKSLQNRSHTQWILDDYFPQYRFENGDNDQDTSFLFLWQRAIWPVDPTAQGIAGMLDPSLNEPTVYERVQQETSPLSLDLLVIDSAKSAKSWKEQLTAVLGKHSTSHNGNGPVLKAGSLLVLMDFEYVAIQVKQIYGCMRPQLLPVYISWNQEHWMFVVTDDIKLTDNDANDSPLANCYITIANNLSSHLPRIEQQLQDDLEFVSRGLRTSSSPSSLQIIPNKKADTNGKAHSSSDKDPWKETRQQLLDHMLHNLRDKPEQWMMTGLSIR